MKGGKKHFTILNVKPKHDVLVLKGTLDIGFDRITILSEIRILHYFFIVKNKHLILKNFICHVFSWRFYLSKYAFHIGTQLIISI